MIDLNIFCVKIEEMKEQGPRIVRKYANRRLYDKTAGKYINLDDLGALIRRGEEVQVVDATTGEDVTRVVLTQIIADDAKDGPAGLPLELLRQLIMASDRAGQEFLMWYLKTAFDGYRKVQESLQNGLSDVRSAALSPLAMVRSLLPKPEPPPQSELEQLRRRVAELEGQVAKKRRRS
jgi:polyhydroxyalkanoate synthesis repressor PhaR